MHCSWGPVAHACVLESILSPPEPPHRASAHLVVEVQVVELPVGPERLRVLVQREVHVPAIALDEDRVPVVVVQQAAAGHRRVALDGAVLVAACREDNQSESDASFKVETRFSYSSGERSSAQCRLVNVC